MKGRGEDARRGVRIKTKGKVRAGARGERETRRQWVSVAAAALTSNPKLGRLLHHPLGHPLCASLVIGASSNLLRRARCWARILRRFLYGVETRASLGWNTNSHAWAGQPRPFGCAGLPAEVVRYAHSVRRLACKARSSRCRNAARVPARIPARPGRCRGRQTPSYPVAPACRCPMLRLLAGYEAGTHRSPDATPRS